MALPMRTGSTDRRVDVLRMLAGSPDGLSDAALAEALGGVRPATVNQLCRRMVAEGTVERTGTRPILNRLVPPPKPPRTRTTRTTSSARRRNGSAAAPEEPATATRPKRRTPNGTPATAPVADRPRREARTEEPVPAPAPVAEPIPAEPAEPLPPPEPAIADAAPPEITEPEPEPDPEPETAEPATNGAAPHAPAYDRLQAWSRAANVQATVATWLTRRGATIRSATVDGGGPARDLVVSLDGDDVHVEVTGWPQDGARTHTTTIAGDWFLAAEQAATARRRAHPRARIVIALPDTRRYRALTRDRATELDGAHTEVWFVDPAGAVDAS